MIGAFVEQRSTEWHEQRAQLITASEAAYALGESKYKTVGEYIHEKVLALSGAEPSFKGNKFTRWGTEKEDTAKGQLEDALDCFIAEEPLTVHPELSWLGASPDGRISSTRGVEIKCPYSDVFVQDAPESDFREACESKMFTAADRKDYWIQMQIQMACCGFEEVVFCVWTPLIMRHEIVKRDDAWLDQNLPKLKEVHDRIRAEYNDPESRARHLEGTQSHTQDNDVLHLSEMYALQYDRTKQMQEQLERIKQRLIDACLAANEEDVETAQLKVKKSTRKGRLNSTKLQKAAQEKGIDIEQFRGEEEETWTVTVKPNRG